MILAPNFRNPYVTDPVSYEALCNAIERRRTWMLLEREFASIFDSWGLRYVHRPQF